MIKVENLSRQYGAKKALNGLSFTAENGSVLGFIGPNGAGKTTAMRMICGIMPPGSGRIEVSGISVADHPREAKEKLGYLPENAPLHAGMNVLAFLRYCGKMHGLSGEELHSAVDDSVEKCRLGSVLYEELEVLSKGFKRRVCLAQAIMHHPENLVLDEPTDGLDPDQKREIRALIREIGKHAAVIVSTHILEEIDAVCDKVLAIRDGRKVFYGTTHEFRALDPEDGALELVFDRLPENFLNSFTTVRLLAQKTVAEGTLVRIMPGDGNRVDLIAGLAAAATKGGANVLRCDVLPGSLEKVFAGFAETEETES